MKGLISEKSITTDRLIEILSLHQDMKIAANALGKIFAVEVNLDNLTLMCREQFRRNYNNSKSYYLQEKKLEPKDGRNIRSFRKFRSQ